MIDRDIYRVKRGQDEKWQDAHLGLIEDVWKTRQLKMGKQATINRLIWDKGWAGMEAIGQSRLHRHTMRKMHELAAATAVKPTLRTIGSENVLLNTYALSD